MFMPWVHDPGRSEQHESTVAMRTALVLSDAQLIRLGHHMSTLSNRWVRASAAAVLLGGAIVCLRPASAHAQARSCVTDSTAVGVARIWLNTQATSPSEDAGWNALLDSLGLRARWSQYALVVDPALCSRVSFKLDTLTSRHAPVPHPGQPVAGVLVLRRQDRLVVLDFRSTETRVQLFVMDTSLTRVTPFAP
jgi:hypothetical protein